jgi:hypothetical protein
LVHSIRLVNYELADSMFDNELADSMFDNEPADSMFDNEPADSMFDNEPADSMFDNELCRLYIWSCVLARWSDVYCESTRNCCCNLSMFLPPKCSPKLATAISFRKASPRILCSVGSVWEAISAPPSTRTCATSAKQ